MYLIILDDGAFYLVDNITLKDYDRVDAGKIQVINMSERTKLANGDWVKLQRWSST